MNKEQLFDLTERVKLVAGVGVHTQEKRPEPIMPTLSDPVREELDRLSLDLEHLGAKDKQSAAVNPNYKTEGVSGDSMRVLALHHHGAKEPGRARHLHRLC